LPRIWRELGKRGLRVGKQRVQRLMQQHGIRARGKRRFRVATTDSRHDLPIAPNRLDHDFSPPRPDTAWAGDITYIATDEGWLFLAVVIDLFSRRVVGWSLQSHMERSLVIDALEMAWQHRRPVPGALLFHSDRGSQYASQDFARLLDRAWHHCLDESQGQLLGQRLQRDVVRIAESGVARWTALRHYP
jgi:putative transposase